MKRLLLATAIVMMIAMIGAIPVMAGQRQRSGQSNRQAKLPKTYMTEQLAEKIVTISRKYYVDPQLITEIMRCETNFRPNLTSPKGAAGLMQFMPGTARRFGITNPYDPDQAIAGACLYLRFLMSRFGRLDLALAGYNAGENAVERHGRRVPPYRETVGYVRSIIANYRRARKLAASLDKDPYTSEQITYSRSAQRIAP
ncbi:MAG: lytic transglycosylase domain-containing protein [Acidobacteriota bacterium]